MLAQCAILAHVLSMQAWHHVHARTYSACARLYMCMCADDTEAARKALASGPVRSNKGQDAAPKAGLCYYASVAGGDAHSLTPTGMCHMRKWRTYGHPGGAVCQGYDNIAQCPRPWQ